METGTQQRLDNILEDEVKRGYRIKAVPAEINEHLTENGGHAIERVRFTRLNPSRRKKISEVVQRQYFKDLQNPDILSREQILKLVQERGEWTDALQKEMQTLLEKTNQEMGELFLDGIARDDWTVDLLKASGLFRSKIKEVVPEAHKESVTQRFNRWLEYAPERQAEYDTLHAEAQGRIAYSVDVDYQHLQMAVPDIEAVSQLETIDDLRDKLQRFMTLQRNRLRLVELQTKHARIFADCVEQRRDNAEEMARLYFTCERVDLDGVPQGPLTPTYDELWELPEEVIQWFLVETYFFQNGIPDEAREYLQTFGFLKADRDDETIRSTSGESEPSDESPAPQSSKLDSSPVEETAPVSSESAEDTTSTTAS